MIKHLIIQIFGVGVELLGNVLGKLSNAGGHFEEPLLSEDGSLVVSEPVVVDWPWCC